MKKDKRLVFPGIKGNLHVEISIPSEENRAVIISGDPEGLKSLSQFLLKMSELDQSIFSELPDDEGFHLHLYPENELCEDSDQLIIYRLDAKKTGEFPSHVKRKTSQANTPYTYLYR